MRKKLLKEVLSIPTYFGREELIKEFLIGYGVKNNIPVKIDAKGNVYLTKGILNEGEYYPCVVAHLDTVHREQVKLINEKKELTIHEDNKLGNKILWATYMDGEKEFPTGIGGDDKAGVFICLEMLKKFDKIIAAFFVEEEFGCKGSLEADSGILKDVGYFIQFDAPTDNWCSFSCAGTQLFNEEIFNIITPILKKNRITRISMDPYTDIMRLKRKFNVACMNFFAGYHFMHTSHEFVILKDIEKAIKVGGKVIKTLGRKKYDFIFNEKMDLGLYETIQNFSKEIIKG